MAYIFLSLSDSIEFARKQTIKPIETFNCVEDSAIIKATFETVFVILSN